MAGYLVSGIKDSNSNIQLPSTIMNSKPRKNKKYNTWAQGWVTKLQKAVIGWYMSNGRDFPWRNTNSKFEILIAEVLLRQTQADRVRKPYLTLISKYPNPQGLAKADVYKLRAWFQPLGLVKRADRLIEAAQLIVHKYDSNIPDDLKDLISLPGIGQYSARAILCLGFDRPYPMIDEGSGRVFRRVLNMPPRGPAYCDSRLLQAVESILPKTAFKEFNLSLIDIASAYCHPKKTECEKCPLSNICLDCNDTEIENIAQRTQYGIFRQTH
jgi:A/G-specific adenine glycosylase